MRILAIMEGKERAAALQSYVARAGHQVTYASNPRSALLLAAKWNPDCVVADHSTLPAPSAEFRKRLAARGAEGSTPVILVDEQATWKSIVDSVAAVREQLATVPTREAAASPTKEEAASIGAQSTDPMGEEGASIESQLGGIRPSILILDERQPSRLALAIQLAHDHGWKVFHTGDVQCGTLALLDEPIDCLLASPRVSAERPFGVIHSASVIRAAHPHPYCIVALVDVENARTLDRASHEGADDIVNRTASPALIDWRIQNTLKRPGPWSRRARPEKV